MTQNADYVRNDAQEAMAAAIGVWNLLHIMAGWPAKTDVEEGDPCPSCGKPLLWDAGERMLFCEDDWSHG
jgi:hypothetical protein